MLRDGVRAHTAALSLRSGLVRSRPHACRLRRRYSLRLRRPVSTRMSAHSHVLAGTLDPFLKISSAGTRRGMFFFFPLNRYALHCIGGINQLIRHISRTRLLRNPAITQGYSSTCYFFSLHLGSYRLYDDNEVVLALRHSKACLAPEIRRYRSLTCLTSYVSTVYATY